MRDPIELDNQDLEEAYNKGKSETIKDKKLVPIEQVLEIIDKQIMWLESLTFADSDTRMKLKTLKEIRSKLGELAKSSNKPEDAQRIIPSDAPIQDKSEDLK